MPVRNGPSKGVEATMVTTRQQIDDFWTHKRLAVVGVSRDPKHFSNTVWQELRQRRY